MRLSLQDDRIVFDLDDTLYLERDFVSSGFRAVGAWLGRADFAAQCQALFDAGCRTNIFNRALEANGLAVPVAELVRVYRDHQPQIRLCTDALRYLRAHPRKFGLITDGPERTQRNKIAALELAEYCDDIIPTGQWPAGFGKPHPRAFQLIADKAQGRRCVYVADNAAKDFVAPNLLGWITIQILRPERVHSGEAMGRDHAARYQVESLDHLDSILSVIRDR